MKRPLKTQILKSPVKNHYLILSTESKLSIADFSPLTIFPGGSAHSDLLVIAYAASNLCIELCKET